MLAEVVSAASLGLDCFLVEVEVDIGAGLPSFTIVGLPDKAVEESKERVRSAIKNAGNNFPQHRLTVNLAPADLKKEGPSYDLPIAVGILLATGQLPENCLSQKTLFVGELSLDGRLRHTNGILPIVLKALEKRFQAVYLPAVNAPEASLIGGVEVIPVESLRQLTLHLKGEQVIKPIKKTTMPAEPTTLDYEYDFAYIKGQEQAKRALEIAAAGGHNVLMFGPPGAGKTLLARALPSILPKMDLEEALEVTKIYSVAGFLKDQPLILARPFRNPHHTTSNVALVGGGQFPRPGEITLAHRGVLFLDEFPEFPRHVLEALRQPLEDGMVTVSRAQGSLSFPAQFILVGAQNPCPCGWLGDAVKQCICSPVQILRYQKRVSGPLLDRIDLHVDVPRVKYEKLASEKVAEESTKVRGRVEAARQIQSQRFQNANIRINAEMKPPQIKKYCQICEKSQELLKAAAAQFNLSARAYYRILKLARTIADLAGVKELQPDFIAEAIQYRPKETVY